MKSDCIFCKIINKEIPSKVIYESAFFIAINNINPKAPIHLLIMPKKHIEKVDSISGKIKDLWSDMMLFTNEVIKAKNLDKTGYRIVNNGAGYQGIDHEHIHLMGGFNWAPDDDL